MSQWANPVNSGWRIHLCEGAARRRVRKGGLEKGPELRMALMRHLRCPGFVMGAALGFCFFLKVLRSN